MKQNLKDAFAQHYNEQSLSQEQLQALNSLAQPSGKSRWLPSISIAASLACLAIMTFALQIFYFSPSANIYDLIASEVAKNHIKMRPMEIETQSMTAIQDYFTELDFVPSTSVHFNMPNNYLIGGRYCSIKGVTAAQLRYRDDSNQWITLYETQYDRSIFPELPQIEQGELPITAYSKGVEVHIWIEKGLLMVSAKSAR